MFIRQKMVKKETRNVVFFVLPSDLYDRIDKVLYKWLYDHKAGRNIRTMRYFSGIDKTEKGRHRRCHGRKSGRRRFLLALFFTLATMVFSVSQTRPAQAYPCTWCACSSIAHAISRAYIIAEHNMTRQHVTQQFILHRVWWVRVYWHRYFMSALQKMTEQLSAVAMQQMQITGAFFDAKHQLETQAFLQALEAQAHRNYHADVEICAIGSHSSTLAAAGRRGELNAFVLAQRLQERQLLGANSSGVLGQGSDINGRIEQFIEVYCDPSDNNNTLSAICGNNADADRVNRDIDFSRTLSQPLSLDVAFDDTDLTEHEADVLALANNLYAHKVLPFLSPNDLANPDLQDEYLDLRSVAAKRSVAENSYNALVGMKSHGGDASPYESMAAVLTEMGIADQDEIRAIVGEHPSYYAQMEFLTKKLYQRPEFYVNLYGKPVNARRKSTAIRAVGLMQNMDLFESQLRSEALLAVLLEMKIRQEHKDVQNRLQRVRAIGVTD